VSGEKGLKGTGGFYVLADVEKIGVVSGGGGLSRRVFWRGNVLQGVFFVAV